MKYEVITKEKGKRPCKCSTHKVINHKKESLSDGWIKWTCAKCGQIKFSLGVTFEEEK